MKQDTRQNRLTLTDNNNDGDDDRIENERYGRRKGKEDDFSGAPWWVRVGFKIGVPLAIAIGAVSFTIWFLTHDVLDGQKSLIAMLTVHVQAQESHAQSAAAVSTKEVELLTLLIESVKVQNMIIQRVCVNTSTSTAERSLCFSASR